MSGDKNKALLSVPAGLKRARGKKVYPQALCGAKKTVVLIVFFVFMVALYNTWNVFSTVVK